MISEVRERLAGRTQERLGQLVTPRRMLGFGRATRIVPVAAAWHVGALLIGDDEVWATGRILRARHEAIRGYTAESQRGRADLAAAAFRGGFAEGESVHIDWQPIDPDAVLSGAVERSGPLSLQGGVLMVRWSPAAEPRPLDDYLADQLALL